MISTKETVKYTILSLTVLIIISYKFGGESLLMSGALSEGHEILTKDCGNCHTPFNSDFKSCDRCHQDIKEVSLHIKNAIKCVFCHQSHNAEYKKINPMTCLSKKCHEKMMKIEDHSSDPQFCFNCHPEHQLDKKALVSKKFSDLIFPHRDHSEKRKIKAYYPCRSCHQISSSDNTIGTPTALFQCNKCHAKWVEKHDVKKSIKEEKCAKCHHAEKKEIKGLGKTYRLKHAKFDHYKHININCTICHFAMKTFNELEDIFIFTQEHKYYLCTQCHLNPFIART